LNTRSFLYDLCISALEIDNSIKFVGVVNIDGKLITGKSKQQIDRQNEGFNIKFLKYCLKSFSNKGSNNNNLNSSMDNKNTIFHSKLFEKSDFQLICVSDNTYIAFTPLTEELEKYLCIYFKMYGSINEIISKLDNVFDYTE
jgi:hypothetical protein